MKYYEPFFNQKNNNRRNSDDDENRRPGAVALFILIFMFAASFALAALYSYYIYDSSEPLTIGTGYYYDLTDTDGGDLLAMDNIPVFNNNSFSDEIIAPGAYGSYTFNFINSGDTPITYSFDFTCVNDYNIELVYKLVLRDEYICGSADSYVTISDLNLGERTVTAGTAETFTLYWYWQHNDAIDTVAGINSASYTLTLSVNTRAAS